MALILACGCTCAAGCMRAAPPPKAAPGTAKPAKATRATPASAGVPIEMKSHKVGSKYVVWTKQKQNRKVYVLRADSEVGQYSGAGSGRSSFVNPHVTFYGSDGKRMVADAPLGTVVQKEKSVAMSGGVHALMQDGTRLASRTLRYDDESETMRGEGDVVVDFPSGEQLRGQTLDWNLRSGRIDVAGAR